MPDVNNVTAAKPAKAGSVYRAPLGTQIPVSTSEQLNAAFKCLGYISEDGVTNSNSPSSDKVKAWGGDTVLNFFDEKPDTWKFKMIEAMNLEVLKTVYGDKNVTGTSLTEGLKVDATSEEYEYCIWVIDMILKGNVAKRIVIYNASVTEVAEIVYKDNESVGYELTISALPNTSSVTHTEYLKTAGGE